MSTDPGKSPPVAGEMETAVRADVKDLGPITGGFRRTFAALSFILARDLDHLVAGEDSATTTRLAVAKELRATLAALARRGDDGDDDDDFRRVADRMSTPVRDAPQP